MRPPFEPLQQVELKMLSFKTALLLTLASAKRRSDIHALSVNPSCMQFSMGDSKVLRKPNPVFVPKVFNPALSYRPIELSILLHSPHKPLMKRVGGAIVIWPMKSRGCESLRPPVGLRAHSAHGRARSALFQGVSVEEMCAAASWAMPHLQIASSPDFSRFYKLDVTAPVLSHTVLSVASIANMPV